MSGIERRAEQSLEHILGLKPVENDPYANIPLAQALDEAYLALHNPTGMTPEQYEQLKVHHSKQVLGVLDSFARRTIFESYRADRNRVYIDPPGYKGTIHFGIHTSGIFTGISTRNEGGHINSNLTYARSRLDPPHWRGGWEYRLDLEYDSEHEYFIGEETFRRLSIKYLQPAGPGEVPVDQSWVVAINNGAITYMQKNFTTAIDVAEEAEEEEPEDGDDGDGGGGDDNSPLPPGPIGGLGIRFEERKQTTVNRTYDRPATR